MPDPSIIDASAQALNNAANYMAAANLNKKTRKWNEKQYDKARADSLADWTRQNEYNSPASQMARLREAGLNPNLVYGKGADNTSQSVHGTDTKSWNPKSPEFNFNAQQSLMLHADLAMKAAQTDNLKVQNTVLDQERILKSAQTLQTMSSTSESAARTARSNFDLQMEQSLKDTTAEFRKGQLRQQDANIQFTLDQNERAAAMQAPNLTKAMEEILTLRKGRAKTDADIRQINEAIENMKKDGELKQLEINLREKGINPNDNIFLRVAAQLLEKYLTGSKGSVPGEEKFAPLNKYTPKRPWEFWK